MNVSEKEAQLRELFSKKDYLKRMLDATDEEAFRELKIVFRGSVSAIEIPLRGKQIMCFTKLESEFISLTNEFRQFMETKIQEEMVKIEAQIIKILYCS